MLYLSTFPLSDLEKSANVVCASDPNLKETLLTSSVLVDALINTGVTNVSRREVVMFVRFSSGGREHEAA